ncbi:hypothetical protein DASC09_009500 [Saccharomycopsis crataegensis]|uniref:Gag1-like clamp domain-containing protein n=1 Tax=Saccharomycopsis crataegensis TaxID=43959 RepID=A0AAV5QFA2_9ASCO|nr:hypothetical protein DASC09_009500 [Saccharomycopsis crataegensis]
MKRSRRSSSVNSDPNNNNNNNNSSSTLSMNPYRLMKTMAKSLFSWNNKMQAVVDHALSSDEVIEGLFGSIEDSDLYDDFDQQFQHDDIDNNNNNSSSSTISSIDSDNSDAESSYDKSACQLPRHSSLQFKQWNATTAMAHEMAKKPDNNTPFADGEKLWEQRRRLWLQGAVHVNPKSTQNHHRSITNPIDITNNPPKLSVTDLSISSSSNNSLPTTPVNSSLTAKVIPPSFEGKTNGRTLSTETATTTVPKPKKIERLLSKREIKRIIKQRCKLTSLANNGVTNDNYPVVYTNLVLQKRKLRKNKAMNLGDLLEVLYDDWQETEASGYRADYGSTRFSKAVYGRF